MGKEGLRVPSALKPQASRKAASRAVSDPAAEMLETALRKLFQLLRLVESLMGEPEF